jgi:hypothetical protein
MLSADLPELDPLGNIHDPDVFIDVDACDNNLIMNLLILGLPSRSTRLG